MNLLNTLLASPLLALPVAQGALPQSPQSPEPILGAAPALPSLFWGDVDGDRVPDLLVLHEGEPRLLLAGQGEALVESTAEYGLVGLGEFSDAVFVDFDADGLRDLYLLGADGARLLRNESGLAFVDATLVSGLTSEGAITKAEWSDVNGDGLPDLTVWTPLELRVHRNLGGSFDVQRVEIANPATKSGATKTRRAAANGAEARPLDGSGARAIGEQGDDLRRGRTRADDAAAGASIAATAGPSYTTTAEQLPSASLAMATTVNCAKFLLDASTQMCITAASVPTLGALYPLSDHLNVDAATNRVGMGTTEPYAKLHVDAFGTEPGLISEGNLAGFFDGRLEVGVGKFNNPNNITMDPRVTLDVGSAGGGQIDVHTSDDTVTMRVLAEESLGKGSRLDMHRYDGVSTVTIDAEESAGGSALSLRSATGQQTYYQPAALAGRSGFSAWYSLNGTQTALLSAEESAGEGSRLRMRRASGQPTVSIDAENANGGAEIVMSDSDGSTTIVLEAEETNAAGAAMGLFNSLGVRTMYVDAEEGKGRGSLFVLSHANAIPTLLFDADTSGRGGKMVARAANGEVTVEIEAEESNGNGAQIVLRKHDGTPSIVLDAEQGGDGKITTDVLEITGGADLVEAFDVSGEPCPPGSVVAIDPASPGQLRLATEAYDSRVAGVVSGAGNVRPGLKLGQAGVLGGDTQVALTGRVYVRCSDENGPIRPGDLLTSSSIPGVAMRATDSERSFGAVIGKAMGALSSESGLVLALVNLQ